MDQNSLDLELDLELVTKDFYRFAKLHSYYKHLPVNPVKYIFYKQQGEQIRNCIHESLTDPNKSNYHYHFIEVYEQNRKLIQKLIDSGTKLYMAKFGCFLRGVEKISGRDYQYFHGFHIIIRKNENTLYDYLSNKYPDIITSSIKPTFENLTEKDIILIAENEQNNYFKEVIEFNEYDGIIL